MTKQAIAETLSCAIASWDGGWDGELTCRQPLTCWTGYQSPEKLEAGKGGQDLGGVLSMSMRTLCFCLRRE
jgi:hypothetical protein